MANGGIQPMPKHTLQRVDKCFSVVIARTIKKTMTANGPPTDRGRFVTRMKMGPRLLSECSFAASEAEVEDAGYSPGGC